MNLSQRELEDLSVSIAAKGIAKKLLRKAKLNPSHRHPGAPMTVDVLS